MLNPRIVPQAWLDNLRVRRQQPIETVTKEPTVMATSPAVPATVNVPAAPAATSAAPATVKKVSFLKTFGSRIKSVFLWLGKPQVQQTIIAGEALGEAVADAINPALAGLNPLINSWTMEIFKAEALAAAAGAQDGTGTQKAAMVLSSVSPQVIQFAEANKLPIPTGSELTLANSLLVQFLNALSGSTAPAAPAA